MLILMGLALGKTRLHGKVDERLRITLTKPAPVNSVPQKVTTRKGISQRYILPTQETAFTLFGIKAPGDAFLAFSRREDNQHFILRLKDSRFDGETQLDVSGLGDNRSIVAEEDIALTHAQYNWFVVFRKEKTLAVYQSGKLDPFIVYEGNNVTGVKDFKSFKFFTVASRSMAEWDFLGKRYRDQNAGKTPDDPALQHELNEVATGLVERVEFSRLVNMQTKTPNNKVQLERAQSIVSSIKPLRTLLRYFNHTDPSLAIPTIGVPRNRTKKDDKKSSWDNDDAEDVLEFDIGV
ncbi:hypothetical protein Pmani_034338 [Petrolisthes manimaculis]|uniref:Uncharacterized protein n=1 Tax=Petrolisthes manimaculis TaxID=1843537 RepID=A0AAE1NNT7_9EUCA|nr:hypothetical protein Pmani_034338 [Petrolisthes manimaculis]